MGQDDGEDDESFHCVVRESKGRSWLGADVWGIGEG